mmetsp:Transcript_8556/g.20328  ORF Transcript_8556/g.20328 Transcript_8556/m.20328 type:complete len:290 (-) Transcript_8556:1483-2352(-)
MIPHGLTDNQRKTPPHWPALCTRTLPHRSRPLARPCFAAEVCLELLLRQQATIERFPNLGLDHVGSDENDLSAPIAETVVLVLLGLGWPLLRRHSHHQPPGTWLEIRRETGGAPLHSVVRVARGPREAFGAEHPREGVSTQHARQTLGVERPVSSVDEAGDAILFGLRLVVISHQLLCPPRCHAGFPHVEAVRIQEQRGAHLPVLAFDHASLWVQLRHDAFQTAQFCGGDKVCLIQDYHIGELRLVHQQVDNAALVTFLSPQLLPGDQLVAGAIILQKVSAVNNGDECV